MGSKQDRKKVESQSLTQIRRLARPGPWDRATEEVQDGVKFADGVTEGKIGVATPYQGYVSYGLYKGSEEADYPYYVRAGNGAGGYNGTIFGVSEDDFENIKTCFETNPMILCSWEEYLDGVDTL